MPYPVTGAFLEALKAPKRDVKMRVTAVEHVDFYQRVVSLEPSLVSFYRLGETTGTTATDSAATNADGTYTGGYTLGAAPGIQNDPDANKAVTLDGTTGYVALPYTAAHQPGDTFSIECWYKRGATMGTDQTLISGFTNGYQLQLHSTNKIRLNKENVNAMFTSLDTFTDNNWHHLVATKAGTDNIHVYQDGVEIPGTVLNSTIVDSGQAVYIGATTFNGSPIQFFHGTVDEVAIYNTALSAEKVALHYRAATVPGITSIADITAPVAEGIVYVDVERATRRTAQIKVINKDGAYTPTSADYAAAGTNALFWWDKYFRLEYGLRVGDGYEYIPLGVFMVDRVDVLAERGVSVINIDGSDLWKKFTFSTFGTPKAYLKNTPFNDVIADFAGHAGVAMLNLDPLDERGATEKQLQSPLYFEIGDNRGEKLRELCQNSWGLEIFFDRSGVLTTRSTRTTQQALPTAVPVWTFSAGEDAVVLSITKSKTGDTIFNHIVVTGENDDGEALVVAEAIDGLGTTVTGKKYTNNRSSPTRVERIGDRVKHIRSANIRTTAAAQIVADSELATAAAIEEDLRLPSIVIPHLEGNDVIEVVETALTKSNDRYYALQFDIPMRGSQQEIHSHKVTVI